MAPIFFAFESYGQIPFLDIGLNPVHCFTFCNRSRDEAQKDTLS